MAKPWERDPIAGDAAAPWANDPIETGPAQEQKASAGFTPSDTASVPADVAKQVGAGLVVGTEAIPAAPARLAELGGKGVEWLAKKFGVSSLFSPEAQQQQADLKALIGKNRGEGIADYLPKPETTAGKYARTASEFVPSAMAMPGNVATNAALGAASGLGSEAGGQLTEGTAAEPYARLGGALLGGAAGTKTAQALAQRAAKQAPADMVGALQDAATPTYKELTAVGNKIVLPEEAGKQMAHAIGMDLHPQALRPANAERTYGQLQKLSKAEDLNDVAIARDKLRDIANGISENKLVSVPRQDAKAARQSVTMLDRRMDELHPGWTAQMKEADSNWAASRRIQTVADYAEADKNFNSFNKNATRIKGYTKDELAAIKQAATGGKVGTALNTVGSALNPFHGGLAPAIQFGMHAAATVPTGGANWLAYLAGAPVGMAADAGAHALKNRAYNKAIKKLGGRSPLGEQQQITSPVQPLSYFNKNLMAGYAAPLLAAPSYQSQALLGR